MSFQEMHRDRQMENFVGRIDEARGFRTNVAAPLDDPTRKSILVYYGQGGMGKSTFLDHCRGIAEAAGAGVAWSDENDSELVGVMESIAGQLGPGLFERFCKQADHYRDRRRQLENRADAPPDFARIAAINVGQVGTKLARHIPVAGMAFELLDDQKVGAQLGEIAAYVAANSKKQTDADLILDPIGVLSPLFVDGLKRALQSDTSVVVFFDTYEETAQYLEPWLIELLLGHYGVFQRNLTIAIAGRHAPNPGVWSPFDALLEEIELEPLSREEAVLFLASRGIKKNDLVSDILEMSQRVPLFLAILAIGGPDGSRASDGLVERVLRYTPRDLRDAAIAGATPRILNRDLGNLLFGQDLSDAAFDWLISMPFVKAVPSGWRFHSVIRREFLRYAKRQSPNGWRDIHLRLVEFFEGQEKAAAMLSDHQGEQVNRFQANYHKLIVDRSLGLQDSTEISLEAWSLEPLAAHPWARNLVGSGKDGEDSGLCDWGENWTQAIESSTHRDFRPAISLFTKICARQELSGQHVLALVCRSDMHRKQGRFDLAVADVEHAVRLSPKEAHLYFRRAILRLDEHAPEAAFQDCETALELLGQPQPHRYAYIRLLRARIIRELFGPSVALEEARELDGLDSAGVPFLEGELLSEMDSYLEAIARFEEAINLDPERTHEGWKEIATAYIHLEQPERAIESIEKSLAASPTCGHCWEMIADVYSRTIAPEDMRETLLGILPAGAEESKVRAYRSFGIRLRGTPFHACEELKCAVDEDPINPDTRLWFTQALVEAGQYPDALQQATECLRLRPHWPEALGERASLRYREGDFAGAEEDWAAIHVAMPDNWPVAALASRGLRQSILGNYADAVATFDAALKLGEVPETFYNRAVALVRLSGFSNVKEKVSEARAQIAKADSRLVRTYGDAGLRALAGEADVALAGLSDAKGLDPELVANWAVSDPAWLDLRDKPQFGAVMDDSPN